MKINFYPRQSKTNTVTIYLWVSWCGNREPFKTDVRVLKTDWNKKKQRVKDNVTGSTELNNKLDLLASKVKDLFDSGPHNLITQKKIEGVITNNPVLSGEINNLLDLYKKFIKDSETGERRTKKGGILKDNTIKRYYPTLANLTAFSEKQDLSFNKIDHLFYNKFTNYMWDQLNYFDNMVGTEVKNLIACLNYGVDCKILKDKLYDSRWVKWEEDTDIVVLYPDEIRALATINFENDKLDRTRDIFLMGCMTCLRVSNLLSLTEQDFDGQSIKIVSVKVEKPIMIKLNPVALQIINKYRYQYDTLLPEISDVVFNRNLKEMAKVLKKHITSDMIGNNWSKPFTRIRYKRGQAKKFQVDISEMISSHTMRRTGITSLLMMGLSEIEVQGISGHEFGSKEFGKYVKIAQQFIDRKAASAWEQIFRVG